MPPLSLTTGYENPGCPVGLEAVREPVASWVVLEPLASLVHEDQMAEVLDWVELEY